MTEEIDQIILASPLWEDSLEEQRESLKRVLTAAREALGLEPSKSAADIILADDRKLQALNHDFRGKDKATNVLSFPAGFQNIPGEAESLGEIYISFETVAQEADSQDKEFIHHFQHMILHGFLHLLGYDHEEQAEAETMEAIEIRILASLNIPNPYEEAQLTHV